MLYGVLQSGLVQELLPVLLRPSGRILQALAAVILTGTQHPCQAYWRQAQVAEVALYGALAMRADARSRCSATDCFPVLVSEGAVETNVTSLRIMQVRL